MLEMLRKRLDRYKDEIFAIENPSPAEGAYSDGLLIAKLTQIMDGRCVKQKI
ncbi:hypothetical protein PIB30_029966 [Stylosanthes scabra]|uniref:Uncharacterized protein n=1 Tax=Stylosanthes scabra TaxID=79078 RepID=A0ABU6XD95_9FABA|nr:hypothetical protein [Stylosanthes scabra]